MLCTHEITKAFGRTTVVDGISIRVRPGEIVGLLGPNGAGKTTTFYMIVGQIRPKSGRITIDDRDITRLPMYRRAKLGLGYLAQDPSVFRKLSVRENVMAVAQARGIHRRERHERVDEVLENLAIADIGTRMGYQLSGGERRRTEIARALVTGPTYMLLDEPFAGVDPRAVEDIQEIVLALKKMNLGVLITDHNVRETLEITDHAYVMHDGKILISGNAADLVANPEARKIYLGDRFRM